MIYFSGDLFSERRELELWCLALLVAPDADCNCMAGSPKKIHVRRTSGSVIPSLAPRMPSPSGVAGSVLRMRSRAWFKVACGGALVNPEEAQTPTAPPFGASSKDSARLSVYTSW